MKNVKFIVLVFYLTLGINILNNNSVSAISNNKEINIQTNNNTIITKENIYKHLLDMGFSKNESSKLINSDPVLNNELLNTEYSNSRYNTTIKISNSDLGLSLTLNGIASMSKATLAKKIVLKMGASAALWAPIAVGSIVGYLNDKAGCKGFNSNIQQLYSTNNDGFISWIVGPLTIKPYKWWSLNSTYNYVFILLLR
ncbi:hypothetical protein [Mycoplasma sp. P36-A1]|uniref:hypothetical protein n=1 Tax=Mycoplasma sp. P36-A1 TaxID=3252900 RepID=UPI003C2E9CBA